MKYYAYTRDAILAEIESVTENRGFRLFNVTTVGCTPDEAKEAIETGDVTVVDDEYYKTSVSVPVTRSGDEVTAFILDQVVDRNLPYKKDEFIEMTGPVDFDKFDEFTRNAVTDDISDELASYTVAEQYEIDDYRIIADSTVDVFLESAGICKSDRERIAKEAERTGLDLDMALDVYNMKDSRVALSDTVMTAVRKNLAERMAEYETSHDISAFNMSELPTAPETQYTRNGKIVSNKEANEIWRNESMTIAKREAADHVTAYLLSEGNDPEAVRHHVDDMVTYGDFNGLAKKFLDTRAITVPDEETWRDVLNDSRDIFEFRSRNEEER